MIEGWTDQVWVPLWSIFPDPTNDEELSVVTGYDDAFYYYDYAAAYVLET